MDIVDKRPKYPPKSIKINSKYSKKTNKKKTAKTRQIEQIETTLDRFMQYSPLRQQTQAPCLWSIFGNLRMIRIVLLLLDNIVKQHRERKKKNVGRKKVNSHNCLVLRYGYVINSIKIEANGNVSQIRFRLVI